MRSAARSSRPRCSTSRVTPNSAAGVFHCFPFGFLSFGQRRCVFRVSTSRRPSILKHACIAVAMGSSSAVECSQPYACAITPKIGATL
eukprot:1740040-Prymnesium_polylepis.1